MNTNNNNKQSSNAPTFPVAKQASRQAKQALASSSNPIETISNFQKSHSLHSFLSKAFGTTSVYSLPQKSGGGGKRVTRGDVELKISRELQGAPIEPLDPESVLTFLNHLGVSRYEIHKKIGDALRVKLESEIQKVDLMKGSSSGSTGGSGGGSSNSSGSAGRETLLKLLKSSWEYIHVPELRPVFSTLIKKLGDQAPVEVLVLLAKKEDSTTATSSTLKYGELLNQFDIPMKRLVWEADWSSVVQGNGQIVTTDDANTNANTNGNTPIINKATGTLHSINILSDVVQPIVNEYMMDENLRKAADLAFPTSFRDKKMDTIKRRAATASSSSGGAGSSSIGGSNSSNPTTGTLSTLTLGIGKSENISNTSSSTNTNSTQEKNIAGVALAKLREIMGSRPKLLSAVLNMLITEHGLQFKSKGVHSKKRLKRTSILGGSSYLHCTLVSDILLSYGQLPKHYEYLQILAQVLDDSVRKGMISDQALAQIQGSLRAIFQPASSEKDVDKKKKKDEVKTESEVKNKKNSATSDKDTGSSSTKSAADRKFELNLLRKIIKKAAALMKENDRQGCFLNPVTDDIAPGYSKVITKPICLSEIEKKAIDLEYTSLSRFESDVQLMFDNCIKYNIGSSGQWFRGEARRQQKKWKDTILKSSKEMHNLEMSKRIGKNKVVPSEPSPKKVKVVVDDAERIRIQQQNLRKLAESKKLGEKRKSQAISQRNDNSITGLLAEDVSPLPESRNKKRKNDTEIPSMPALASILLSDPLVMRLLLFKVLNAMKNDILKNEDVPANHKTVPSVMQLLYIVQISTQLCAKKGKIYVIPDVGFAATTKKDSEDKEGIVSESYIALRKYTPLVTKLMLEAEVDKRFSIGGDFHSHLSSARSETKAEEWAGSTISSSVLLCLVQGALVPLLQPSASNEMSLLVQLPRFFTAIGELSGGNMVNEKAFFVSLSQTILKHKYKLPHSVRDLIVKNWLCWFSSSDGSSSMTGAVHLSLLQLLNEWSSLGNRIMPRDTLLAFSEDAAKAAEANEKNETLTFSHYWNNDALGEVKVEYERMLKNLPEERCLKWKQAVGLQTEETNEDDVDMQET